jgi:hypothetical protein
MMSGGMVTLERVQVIEYRHAERQSGSYYSGTSELQSRDPADEIFSNASGILRLRSG